MTPEQEQEIIELRAKNLTPKLIARKLGLKVSEVSAFIKGQAQQVALERAASGALDPIAECLVNASCFDSLFGDKRQREAAEDSGVGGLGLVAVARTTGQDKFILCTYLVDYWCLGVKDMNGPRKLNGTKYKELLARSFSPFNEQEQKITLAQAQAIVLGAVNYAKELGLSPHKDFEKGGREHLGEWNGEPQLTFGREGKPLYVSGPHDNPERIIKTLRDNVGEGNFDYMLGQI